MDSNSNNVISYYSVRTEKDIYYELALNRLRKKAYIIQLITNNRRRGLMKDLFNTSVQMCQFLSYDGNYDEEIKAGKELKIIAKILIKSSKNEFYRRYI